MTGFATTRMDATPGKATPWQAAGHLPLGVPLRPRLDSVIGKSMQILVVNSD